MTPCPQKGDGRGKRRKCGGGRICELARENEDVSGLGDPLPAAPSAVYHSRKKEKGDKGGREPLRIEERTYEAGGEGEQQASHRAGQWRPMRRLQE